MPAANNKSHTKQEVAAIAARIRNDYFAKDNPMEGLLSLLEALKGKVKVNSSQPDETLSISEDSSFIITIPHNTSPLRDVFTLAHELGHYFLHTDFEKPGSVVFNRSGSTRDEIEANWFAADLLMPEEAFRIAAHEFDNNHHKLAARFGVSGAAARVRMSVLGLI